MLFRFYVICLLSLLISAPLFSQNDGLIKFDPNLQRALQKKEHIELLRHAEPGVASPALSKIEALYEPRYNVIFHGDNNALDELGIRFNTRLDGIATARVTLYELLRAGHHPGIGQIEKGGMMTPTLDRSIGVTNAKRVHDGEIMNIPYKGRDVLIGIIDTGINFFHPDFRDPIDQNKSRVISIWDVQLDPEGDEEHPADFDYGVEYTRENIERELRGETDGAVRSIDEDGHGTHVAGIAGGNGFKLDGQFTGIAPEAEFVIVSFPDARFFPAEIIDAMNYIFTIADELGRPAVVNLSIGGHGGAHDGTGGHEQAIDHFSNRRGNAVTVAAGNSGDHELHYGSTIDPSDEASFDLQIPSYQPDLYNNDDYVFKMLWYESNDVVEVTVTSPNGYEVSAQSGDSVLVATPDGAVELNTFDNFRNPKNARVFGIDIHSGTLQDASLDVVPPQPGDWTITVSDASEGSAVKFNSWIVSQTMDRPRLEPNTGRDYTVTMPGTAGGAITVGSYVSKTRWTNADGENSTIIGTSLDLSFFSGGGPTRDERRKPDITAPGHAITSTLSNAADFNNFWLAEEEGYVNLVGTSMASPHLAGIAAIIFEANPNLTGREVIDILRESGDTDAHTGIVPNNAWGYGKVNALTMFDYFTPLEGIPEKFYLYQNYPNPFNDGTTIRFTIPQPTHGKLAVYDVLGRKVDVIIEGDLEPRVYFESFDGSNLSSGVYFYRLETSDFTEVKKMILLR